MKCSKKCLWFLLSRTVSFSEIYNHILISKYVCTFYADTVYCSNDLKYLIFANMNASKRARLSIDFKFVIISVYLYTMYFSIYSYDTTQFMYVYIIAYEIILKNLTNFRIRYTK